MGYYYQVSRKDRNIGSPDMSILEKTCHKVEKISEPQFLEMGIEWNNLLSESDNNNIFLTHEWVASWWQVFKENKEFFSLTVRDENNELIGIAPLFIEKEKYFKFIPFTVVKFLGMNSVQPDYLGFIIKRGLEKVVIPSIVDALIKHQDQWDLLLFGDLTFGISSNDNLIQTARQKGFLWHIDRNECPYLPLPQNEDEFYSHFKKKKRYNLKRQVRLLSDNFRYEYARGCRKDENHKLMDRLIYLHKNRAKSAQRGDAFHCPAIVKFHHLLVDQMFDKKWLMLYYIKLNDEIECCLYAFCYDQKFYFYQSGFNPRLAKYSLGSVIVLNTILSAIGMNCREYDFLKGNEQYKFSWTKDIRITETLFVCRKSIKSFIYFYLIKLQRLCGKTVRAFRKRVSH